MKLFAARAVLWAAQATQKYILLFAGVFLLCVYSITTQSSSHNIQGLGGFGALLGIIGIVCWILQTGIRATEWATDFVVGHENRARQELDRARNERHAEKARK